jgi:hypothetical protein
MGVVGGGVGQPSICWATCRMTGTLGGDVGGHPSFGCRILFYSLVDLKIDDALRGRCDDEKANASCHRHASETLEKRDGEATARIGACNAGRGSIQLANVACRGGRRRLAAEELRVASAEAAIASQVSLSRGARLGAGDAREEMAETGGQRQPIGRFDAQPPQDRRCVGWNRPAFTGRDLSSGPVE